MPSKIRILDDATINQIAAGEVIENSASVVKELVENALDAEATSICVEIKGGGRQLIRITDNGMGMSQDDALLCFERHATSKVGKIEDLELLNTMGFRGEALPSIASIARVMVMTRPKELNQGTLVEINGGAIQRTSSVPCEQGTRFEIADLFYNVPARKKFLKSPAHDLQEVQKTISALALGNPEVHFQLISDGIVIFDFPKTDQLAARAKQILHDEVSSQMLPVNYAMDKVLLNGLIGWPTLNRPNRTGQTLFINKRPVTSWLISQAVLEGYGTALPERRYPLFVLHLDIPPSEIDVNVHPQKKEVRFRHEMRLKEIVKAAIDSVWGIPLPSEKRPAPAMSNFEYQAPLRSYAVQESLSFSFPEKKLTAPAVLHTIAHYAVLDYSPLHKGESGLCLFDSSQARSRIIYEKILAGLNSSEQQQQLIVPITIELSFEESHQLSNHLALIEKCGFSLRLFGKNSWIVESIPQAFEEGDVQDFLKELLHNPHWQEDKLQQIAHSAARIRKTKHLNIQEARLLLEQLMQCQQPHFSPKSVPIFSWIAADKLKDTFK